MKGHDHRTKLARSVGPWMHTLDSEPNKIKYRAHWTAPLAIDPFDHDTVYFGAQVIFKTTNGGSSWSVISPDLSTQNPRRVIPIVPFASSFRCPSDLRAVYGGRGTACNRLQLSLCPEVATRSRSGPSFRSRC
jgi:hypothetical protein